MEVFLKLFELFFLCWNRTREHLSCAAAVSLNPLLIEHLAFIGVHTFDCMISAEIPDVAIRSLS